MLPRGILGREPVLVCLTSINSLGMCSCMFWKPGGREELSYQLITTLWWVGWGGGGACWLRTGWLDIPGTPKDIVRVDWGGPSSGDLQLPVWGMGHWVRMDNGLHLHGWGCCKELRVQGACCDGKPRREPSIWNLKKESYWAWLAIRCWPPARNGEVHSRVWSGGNENQHLKIYSHGPQLENDVVPTLGQEQVATLEEFRYLGVLFMSEWEAEQEIHRWLVPKLQSCGRSTGTSWWRESWVDLRPSTLTWGHERWVVTERTRFQTLRLLPLWPNCR